MTENTIIPDQNQPAGSPLSGEPVFLVIGKLRKPHGIHGEIAMEILTDFPERLQTDSIVFVGAGHQPLCLSSFRQHQNYLLVSFEGISTPEEAGAWRNQWVYVSSASRPALPEGEYYHHQLIGLHVESETGEPLGLIVEILETGSNDVLVVHPEDGAEILLPIIDEVVKEIDLEAGRVVVHLLPGLRP